MTNAVAVLEQLEGWLRGGAASLGRQRLLARHPGLRLGRGCRLEGGVLWRLAPDAEVVVGAGCHLRRGVELKADRGARLTLGSRVHIGPWSTLSVLNEVEIGDDCLIAECVSLRDHDHALTRVDRPYRDQGYTVAPVRLGANVWLGAHVTVVKGVTLGAGCVVAAGAVVTRSFPAGSLVAGVPARLLRSLPGHA
ncbi:MAG: acyltransferase [Candidatus Sericytochromatia bacterium]|nr:acyltransferase [Candidatus Sericytochromatia bacterium]